MAPVDPGQQVTELCWGDRDRAVGRARPQKPPTLQPLGEQARPLTVVPNHFQKITAATAEAEQMTVQRITPQHFLYLQRQARKSLAHIGGSGRQPHPNVVRGRSTHCELDAQISPERLEKALNSAKAVFGRPRKWRGSSGAPYHAHLSMIGDSIGEACWLKGHAAGLRRKAPAEGRIRVDLTLNELLQLSWLAHLGFSKYDAKLSGF